MHMGMGRGGGYAERFADQNVTNGGGGGGSRLRQGGTQQTYPRGTGHTSGGTLRVSTHRFAVSVPRYSNQRDPMVSRVCCVGVDR